MKDEILYISTNSRIKTDQSADPISFKEALLMGLAPDGGLFMPTTIPTLSPAEILELKGCSYSELALKLLHKFLYNDIDDKSLKAITKDAYNFDIPIETLDPYTYLVRLDQGPTASFKDFAARFMARAMKHLKSDEKDITILVATSGDTGSAVGNAYKGLEGFRVFILYPIEEVSSIQKNQLDNIGDNVQAVAVQGKFDDCQKIVKKAFSDPDMTPLNLTSANSINIGRLLPQTIYYFYSYLSVVDSFQPVIFSIPSGNFGNSLGCELARRMGLPVEKIVIAVNENDEFPDYLNTGNYQKVEPSRMCYSNAMNVGNPSNLARFFDLYDGIINSDGTVIKTPDLPEIKKHIFSTSITDIETVQTIKSIYKQYGTIVEPHGAVGLAALKKYRDNQTKQIAICLETAAPAKFPEIIEKALGITPEFPETLRKMNQRNSEPDYIDNDYNCFKEYLLEKI